MLDLLKALRDYLREEGRVIRQAPAAFAFGVLLVGVLVFAGVTWHYSERISVLETEAKASAPDVIARLISRVDALETKMSTAIVPRTLSDHNKNIIKTEFSRSKFEYKTLLVFTTFDPESVSFAIGFAEFLKSAGISNLNGPVLSAATIEQCGVMVGVADTEHPSAQAADFYFTLDAAGLNPKYTKWSAPMAEFDLFIGPPCK